MRHQNRYAAVAARRSRVPLEECVLRLSIERGRRLVENENNWLIAHEAAGQRELLPLAEAHVHAVRPCRAELAVEPAPGALHDVVGAGARCRDRHRLAIIDPRHVAISNRVERTELEAEEV